MGLSKLFLAGRILQRRGLRTVSSRVLSTSKSRAKEQCDDTTPANEWSAVTTMMTGDGGGCQIIGGNKNFAVVGAYKGNDGIYELSTEAKKVDGASGGKLSKELNESFKYVTTFVASNVNYTVNVSDNELRKIMIELHLRVQKNMDVGKAFVVTDVGNYSAVAIAGYGPFTPANKEDLDEKRENVRWGVGAGVQALRERGALVVEVDPGTSGLQDASSEAAMLAAWQFDKYKSEHDKWSAPEIQLLSGCTVEDWEVGVRRGEAQNWARYLSDMPANKMTPGELAQAVLDKLCPKVKVVAHDRAWIEAQGMEAFLAVARGSCEEPVFLECEWKKGNGPTVLVAAKGVTFDCGGICLKEHKQMKENRGSMAGAAAALGAMSYIKASEMDINVTMVIPLCENMISGQCMKVGDVVRTLNGLNIQIEDTDMEGRLMLADALVYGQAAHKPEVVIDVATLTHGIRVATGGGAFGAFTNDDELWDYLRKAGERSGDRPWRFPLWDYYHRRIVDDSSFDLRNRGSEDATPCVGAAFLNYIVYFGIFVLITFLCQGQENLLLLTLTENFVCGRWIHMDTTGVAKLAHDEPPYLSRRRMSGRPTRTLICLLEELAKKLKK